ncbi:MAG TPA: aminoacyl-tRNA hydrolase [Actinomycetota bacterium]|nr:aminoacyl-tRNA hydrolase [Actinomycetota bacterium]
MVARGRGVFPGRRGNRPSYLIVGIGNPGPAYARTRHNVGTRLVELLAEQSGAELKRTRGQARVAEAEIDGHAVVLAVPTTYMNESGRPVARLVRKQGISPDRLVVVQDELDLSPGTVRLKVGGGTAGHNGLESIQAALRSRDFLRLRIGVGKPPSKEEGADHVLSRMRPEDAEAVEGAIERGLEAMRVLVRDGVDAAQNLLHAR